MCVWREELGSVWRYGGVEVCMCGGRSWRECVEVGGGAGECVKTNTANNHLCIPFSLPPFSFSLSSFLLPSFPLLSPLSFSRGMLFSAVQQLELPLAMPTLLPLLFTHLLPFLLPQLRLTLASFEITSVCRLSFVPIRSEVTI